ncbi:MBOAT family protein [Leptospira gomenensis]|uniref:MBOAT family protein n=1 Tax=Leptospira gomenensis TaxID=2484974 RepID=A0A5F1YEZ7_9LEPT|nr:MBOAT family O-acyltransferase [Leptospira gomenensis]TGK37440.1 MBOAT family protein [Leptospira gomenensis]TGK40799.1 MBOAT family protein [Leptospira gomenensis]TGK43025.1 MBOAT family protein [Leptospira gomenensis]TGK54275.1 MBOAT family protein [Leptospira gomenensis]
MLFNSVQYLIFAPVVILAYFWLPVRFQRVWLLLASLYFYAIFKIPFILLLVYSIVLTYYSVRGMDAAAGKIAKLFFLNLAVWGNLALLYVFKYMDFSIQAWNLFVNAKPCDPAYVPLTGAMLPMGISFFTLQAISYAVDVYRGTVPQAKSLFQFGLFLSFFPQLVAGPIIRAQDMLHQFLENYVYRKENLLPGIRQLSWGLFKKTFVADPISLTVDPVFSNPGAYDSGSLLLTSFLFSFQIYCDFSGYSDVAIGTGRIMGYRIPENFVRPFLSQTVTEFWRRWHISFSSWLRDYIYISLGGNRVSIPRAYFNVFITTFVSGIWHGADWNFVIWGACHASVMVFERFIFSFSVLKRGWDKIPEWIKYSYPFFVFSFSMFFFRAKPSPEYGYSTSLDLAFAIVKRSFSFESGQSLHVPFGVIFAVVVLFGADFLQEKRKEWMEGIQERPWVVYSLSAMMILVGFILYSVTVSQPFLYFQF